MSGPVSGLKSSPNVKLHTKDLDICDGQQAEIYAESWKDVVGQIKEIVIKDPSRNDANCISMHLGPDRGIIYVNTLNRENIFSIGRRPVSQQWLRFDGNRVEGNHTLRHYNIGDKSSLDLFTEVTGSKFREVTFRKPVIYLFAPVSVDASVGLSLVPQWSLSAIYLISTNIKSGAAGTVSWRVRVHPEGHLTELSTGLDITYLYWEALANSPLPSSPPASPLLGYVAALEPCIKIQAFDPTNASLNDANAVIISVDKVTSYFDATLKALGLHIEARTSFITYWLPSLLEHGYIAFRFLPQESYEQAARLDVFPTPDVVTRIFMVFKGIDESELEAWPAAQKRVNESVPGST